jgi:hypothetical protein
MGCAYFAATETDANLPHVAETSNRMLFRIVEQLHRSSKLTMLCAVVRPSSPVTDVRAPLSLALVAGTVFTAYCRPRIGPVTETRARVRSAPCRPPAADVHGETDRPPESARCTSAGRRRGDRRRHAPSAAGDGPLHSPRQSCAAVGAAGGRVHRL